MTRMQQDEKYTPCDLYQHDLDAGLIQADAAQAKAMQQLNAIYSNIVKLYGKRNKVINYCTGRANKPIQGLYCWGRVGSGKTYLMDLFYHSLPIKAKARYHLHRFMRKIHAELKSHQGQSDPLQLITQKFAQEVKVLCFDEFVVTDIVDAMILGQLFTYLFAAGVCVIATSNFHPDDLYEDGLKRNLFLPAIAGLKAHMQVLQLDSGVDYRKQDVADLTQRYLIATGSDRESMNRYFEQLSGIEVNSAVATLELNNRDVPIIAHANKAAWFEFDDLCHSPRSQYDYLDIGDQFDIVLLSGLKQMSVKSDDQARRFILLIDALYDSKKQLIISADVPIGDLYTGKRLAFEFQRTISRLNEMQHANYGIVRE